MRFQNLFRTDDERAVSPVIGVILMVAITVILAAVIASFVLGLGDSQEVSPTATFDFDYDADDGNLTITHTGGDNIRADEVYVRGQSINTGSLDGTQPSEYDDPDLWYSNATYGNPQVATNSTEIDDQAAVTSGDSWTVNADTDYIARVVWEATSGSSSSELATDRGPDA